MNLILSPSSQHHHQKRDISLYDYVPEDRIADPIRAKTARKSQPKPNPNPKIFSWRW